MSIAVFICSFESSAYSRNMNLLASANKVRFAQTSCHCICVVCNKFLLIECSILLLQASSAITLTMEVSYPFHSHLIGRSGQNVNKLMEQSGTRIHFPDTNRVAGHQKSNTVVVRGSMAAAENVRQRIRVRHFSSTPLYSYCFHCNFIFLIENHAD